MIARDLARAGAGLDGRPAKAAGGIRAEHNLSRAHRSVDPPDARRFAGMLSLGPADTQGPARPKGKSITYIPMRRIIGGPHVPWPCPLPSSRPARAALASPPCALATASSTTSGLFPAHVLCPFPGRSQGARAPVAGMREQTLILPQGEPLAPKGFDLPDGRAKGRRVMRHGER